MCRIEGGTNTNVVPGKVSFKLDRRMIPEENAAEVEADIHRVSPDAAATFPGIRPGDLRRRMRWAPAHTDVRLMRRPASPA